MGSQSRALLGGFGTTTSSLEVGGQIGWPSNNPLDFNQTVPWGIGGASAAAMSFGLDNLTTQESVTKTVIKEKNWPALLILVIIALTVGGNILVILAVSLEKKLQNATNFFLRSLAVADMLVGILVMPISLINILYGVSMPIPVIGLHNEDKVFVNGSCVLNEEHFMLIGSFVAFFIPLVIMVVTYCLTIQVLQRQATVFLYEAKSSSQQPLSTPAITLQPPPSPFNLPQINTLAPPDSQELKPPPFQSRRNTLSCLKGPEPTLLLTASTSDSLSIIPSSEAASQLSSPATGPGRTDASGCHGRRGMMQAIKNEKRASKVLGIVFFLFLVMWCPFFITNVTFVLCRDSCNESLLHDLLNVFVWVGYISSGVNPLVYTLFNKTYRRAFSNYIRCQYKVGANAVGQGGKSFLTPQQCPSHAVTPLLTSSHDKAGVDRNSNCRNGSRGDNGRMTVDPEDTTDDGTQIGLVSQSLSECHNAGMLSETEPETEIEQELSLLSYPSPREHTSSV
ncbi:5-hydroxytryptamine (serotonin) receptor 2C, G protein-coupled-like 1 isoform X2 [Girardinichthys multiradiatus]|uniref:5-hydroxytryptamine (serotonin) receptor 2C, G protein-coupled-like 1 isoform X2 n=1 Tax=Girardinichthys multiradiatus TaxID=208333 RepID=UPI001FAE5CA5|nr:5-hydroxytryptamine (serotonin) receptor 2C, G protein-coupled-like 1 isoform X2 [Girardinichthys multiradiatus]